MSLPYLTEYADSVRIALDLAEHESAHLRYTYRTLYADHLPRMFALTYAIHPFLGNLLLSTENEYSPFRPSPE